MALIWCFFFTGAWLVVFRGVAESRRFLLQVGLSVYWDVTLEVILLYVHKIKTWERMPALYSFLHISLILFFLCVLWLLWCALSCQCVQADLFFWCMHNLVFMKPPWRRGPLKHKRCMCMCVCLHKVSAGCNWCAIIMAVMRPQSCGSKVWSMT